VVGTEATLLIHHSLVMEVAMAERHTGAEGERLVQVQVQANPTIALLALAGAEIKLQTLQVKIWAHLELFTLGSTHNGIVCMY